MSLTHAGGPRLVATMGVAGLLSGLLLVGVYMLTAPRIRENRIAALERAIKQVLPGTERIETFLLVDGALTPADADAVTTQEAAFAGYTVDDTLVGWAIAADGPGFMDTIRLIYGLDVRHRRIIGMRVLDSRETPGLGDKIADDPAFHKNFAALEIEPEILAVKRGTKTQAHEVDCITGATISSEAVVSILNESARRWAALLEERDVVASER